MCKQRKRAAKTLKKRMTRLRYRMKKRSGFNKTSTLGGRSGVRWTQRVMGLLTKRKKSC